VPGERGLRRRQLPTLLAFSFGVSQAPAPIRAESNPLTAANAPAVVGDLAAAARARAGPLRYGLTVGWVRDRPQRQLGACRDRPALPARAPLLRRLDERRAPVLDLRARRDRERRDQCGLERCVEALAGAAGGGEMVEQDSGRGHGERQPMPAARRATGPVQNWRENWRERPLRTRKAPCLRGLTPYRQRDSNPCYRRERAAS
jgi:hypothetical protein